MQPLKTTNGPEPSFQVEGDIVYLTEIRRSSGAEPLQHSRHFVVTRRGQQWKIRATNIKTDELAYPTYDGAAWMTEKEVETKCQSPGMQYEKQTAQN